MNREGDYDGDRPDRNAFEASNGRRGEISLNILG